MWLAIPLARRSSPGSSPGWRSLVACLNVLLRDIEHILTAALLPWFFLTPILWSAGTCRPAAQSHQTLLEVLQWGNSVAPPIAAVRDALWSGHAPQDADVVYLVVAAVVALVLGAFVFGASTTGIAVEL